ncbi:MAG TPA: MerR family transcriptional regulator [Terriglobales bacterium]|nr:MerR family transcriptional regulator [Terriglobales bacterium]
MMMQIFSDEIVSGLFDLQTTFTSRDAVYLTGITARLLEWWDESGIVVPIREGYRRLYSLDVPTKVAASCEMRDRGFPLQKICRVIGLLQREFGMRGKETVRSASEFNLLPNGRHTSLEDFVHSVVDFLTNSRQPKLSVFLSDTVERIFAEIKVAEKQSTSARDLSQQRRKAA